MSNKVQDVLEVSLLMSGAFISISCLVRCGLMWQSFFLLRHKSDLLLYLTGIVKPVRTHCHGGLYLHLEINQSVSFGE